MISPIELVQNDTLPFLDFTIEKDGVAVNLTSATVVFSMKNDKGVRKIDKQACSLVTPLSGICRYELQLGDTDTAGTFNGEIQITFPGGTKQTSFENIPVVIKGEIA